MSNSPQSQSAGVYELLYTKLQPPRLPSNLIPCQPLFERLTEGLNRKLTLLSAQAGFGKTTLIGQWLARLPSNDASSAWLWLDAGDNDPLRFWRYVIISPRACIWSC